MAIEFNCPYCSAIIRVPDSAAGGKGKCPRCTRRITVPKTSQLRTAPKPPAEELGVFGSPEPEPPGQLDASAPVTFAAAGPEAVSDEPFDFLASPASTPGAFPVDTPRRPLPQGSVSSKLKKKKSGGLMIPVIFGLILCGVVGWYVWQNYQTERLVGELTAQTGANLELPPAEVETGTLKQSPDEVKGVLERLEKSPIRIPSTLMSVQIGAKKRALSITVNSGPDTTFYRVDMNNPALAIYRKNHAFELEAARAEEVEQYGSEFIAEYVRVMDKKSGASSLTDFRNKFALPALVRGLGHQVVAVAGQTTYPCVYEDGESGLYFLMPPDLQKFEVIGRKHSNGRTVFPGKYQVTVSGELKSASREKTEPADKKKKKSDKKDGEEKPEMMESSEEGEMKKSEK